MRSYIEKPQGIELTYDQVAIHVGECFGFVDLLAVLRYYKREGKQVYYLYDGCYMKSDDVDKYVNYDYVKKNCYSLVRVEPITSIRDFSREIDKLGDWKDPKNHAAYVKIMLQFVGMYSGYRIDLTLEDGIEGKFQGNYPSAYIDELIEILKTKFPTMKDIYWGSELYPQFENDDDEFYRYLGNFCRPYGISILAEHTKFLAAARESGMVYDDSRIDLETIRSMAKQVTNSNVKKIKL